MNRFAIAFTIALIATQARAERCEVDGAPAICRSAKVERQAEAIAQRLCRRCHPQAIADAVYSMEMNRGPYRDANKLARDALLHVR